MSHIFIYSPFYGKRRPLLQRGAKLLCVSDLLLLGRVTIEEARSLLYWLDSEAGFGKLGVCGISMGKNGVFFFKDLQEKKRGAAHF